MKNEDINIKKLAESKGILIGAEIDPTLLEKEEKYADTLKQHFNCTVAGNHMKFKYLEPEKDKFTFDIVDRMINFAQKNQMKIRGHTLCWHHESQLPDWILKKELTAKELEKILVNHIQKVVSHFKGKVFAWDVINEGINHQGDGLRKSNPWIKAIGEEVFDIAFHTAHQADPDCILFYNDYEIETINQKSDFLLELLRKLLKRGVPIHGIGFQYHYPLEKAPSSGEVLKNMKRFEDLGLQIHITELDIWLKMPYENSKLIEQANAYKEAFKAAINCKSCKAVLTWGFTDKYSWIPHFTKGAYGDPLIFDKNYLPKPAYYAICEVLNTIPKH